MKFKPFLKQCRLCGSQTDSINSRLGLSRAILLGIRLQFPKFVTSNLSRIFSRKKKAPNPQFFFPTQYIIQTGTWSKKTESMYWLYNIIYLEPQTAHQPVRFGEFHPPPVFHGVRYGLVNGVIRRESSRAAAQHFSNWLSGRLSSVPGKDQMKPAAVVFNGWTSRWWFQIFLEFSPLFWEDSHFDEYFSKGLVQPPTRNGWDPSICFFFPFVSDQMWGIMIQLIAG